MRWTSLNYAILGAVGYGIAVIGNVLAFQTSGLAALSLLFFPLFESATWILMNVCKKKRIFLLAGILNIVVLPFSFLYLRYLPASLMLYYSPVVGIFSIPMAIAFFFAGRLPNTIFELRGNRFGLLTSPIDRIIHFIYFEPRDRCFELAFCNLGLCGLRGAQCLSQIPAVACDILHLSS